MKFKDAIGFSKLDTYRSCPAKFKYQFIEKIPQPSSAALERGSKLHDDCESYLRGWINELGDPLDKWKEALDHLKTVNVQCEQAWGFDKDWNLLKDWFQPETWLRAKSDAHYIKDNCLYIIDFKSGKYRVPSTEQIEMYAICGHSVYPQVTKVQAEFWFLDCDEIYTKEYTGEHLIQLRKKYEQYFAPIFNDETWAPSPSRECRWCSYSKSKGGKCEF